MDILHKVTVNGEVGEVYNAIATEEGLSSWWTSDLSFQPMIDGEAIFRFPGAWVKGRVVSVVPEEKIHIVFDESENMNEWIKTELIIKIEEKDSEQTELKLAHRNWQEPTDYYMQCNYIWALLLRNLETYIEEGASSTVQDMF